MRKADLTIIYHYSYIISFIPYAKSCSFLLVIKETMENGRRDESIAYGVRFKGKLRNSRKWSNKHQLTLIYRLLLFSMQSHTAFLTAIKESMGIGRRESSAHGVVLGALHLVNMVVVEHQLDAAVAWWPAPRHEGGQDGQDYGHRQWIPQEKESRGEDTSAPPVRHFPCPLWQSNGRGVFFFMLWAWWGSLYYIFLHKPSCDSTHLSSECLNWFTVEKLWIRSDTHCSDGYFIRDPKTSTWCLPSAHHCEWWYHESHQGGE